MHLLLFTVLAAASPPDLVTHSMRLTDASGNPVEGTHKVTVGLFESPTSGPQRWTDDFFDVPFSNGYAAVVLGSDAPLTPAHLDYAALWVGVSLDDGPELIRTRLTSVPYAMVAGSSSNLTAGRSAFGNFYCFDGQSGGGATVATFTFSGNAGQKAIIEYTVDGRPNAGGHLYSQAYLNGTFLGSGSEYGNSTWRRHLSGREIVTLTTTGTQTARVDLSCGSGASYFADNGGEYPLGGFQYTVTVID